MPEKFGIEKTKPFVVGLAKIASGVSSFFHGGGLLALWPVVNEASALRTTDFKGMLDEAGDVSSPEAVELNAAFDQALVLANKDVEVKIESVIGLARKAGAKISENVQWGKDFYAEAKAVFVKA